MKTIKLVLTILAIVFIATTTNKSNAQFKKIPNGAIPRDGNVIIELNRNKPNPTVLNVSVTKISSISTTPSYKKRIRVSVTLKNIGGAKYTSNENQQGVLLTLVEGTIVRSLTDFKFVNLAVNEVKVFTFDMDWYSPEFPPSIKAEITYDPDILNDSNTGNDDSNLKDNMKVITGETVNAVVNR